MLSTGTAQLHIPLSREELAEVEDVARQVNASVQHVSLYAVWKLMGTIWDGDVTPLLAPSRFYTAVEASLPPASRQGPRLSVGMTSEYYTSVVKRARRHKTSPAVLGQVAVRQMLVEARAGNLPHEAAAP